MLLQYDQQMHTLHFNCNNVLIHTLLHVLGFTRPLSGSAQSYKTINQPFCHSPYVELSQVCQGMNIAMRTVI